MAPTPIDHSPPPLARVEVERILDVARAIVAGGPREATSRVYRDAGGIVERELRALGLDTSRMFFDVPAGVSWGIAVPDGRSFNVIADVPGFDARARHLIVGAHLDTVPQAPGANDNASGVAVMVELARLAMLDPPAVSIRFIAFGAEEPRAPGDDGHHYGSRAYVARMSRAARDGLLGMISLDRVGIGRTVRVCTGGAHDALARMLLRRARVLDIDAERCVNRTSDHWSFERNGLPGVRLLGADDPDYHTARDRMRVLERDQLERVATLAWRTIKQLD